MRRRAIKWRAKTAIITAIFLCFGCSAQADQTTNAKRDEVANSPNKIPLAYRGEWTNEQKYCGHDGDDMDSRLFVGADYVGFFESQWTVTSAAPAAGGIRITYKPNDDADVLAPPELRLSDDSMIIFTNLRRKGEGYRKCPSVDYGSAEETE